MSAGVAGPRSIVAPTAMLPFLEIVIGAIVWTIANVVYLDLKRKGQHGFTRFAAFWLGTPTTWITLFAVSEGQHPTFETSGDDDEGTALLVEIRRDRALRAGSADGAGEPPEDPDE